MPGCMVALRPEPAPLIQIRHGYAADCGRFRLAVEVDAEGWRGEVVDGRDGRTLYTAHRCSLNAAKNAAAEFVSWSGDGPGQKTAETMARQLAWREYW